MTNKEGTNQLLIQLGNGDPWQCNEKRSLQAIGGQK